jgi:hypothetical protein
MLYFAFGSNLDERQMRERCPDARLVGPAVLPNHVVCFAGFSRMRGGGVASLVARRGWKADGVLYDLSASDFARLDMFEGHPIVYERCVKLLHAGKRKVRAHLYLHHSDAFCPPASSYFGLIRRGYLRFGFDLWPLKMAARGLT